jgi:hypothetical protein
LGKADSSIIICLVHFEKEFQKEISALCLVSLRIHRVVAICVPPSLEDMTKKKGKAKQQNFVHHDKETHVDGESF